ncbi:hypothetical protein J1N35_002635 [Gossypium stocksii]|uniref:C2 domain-containing protein n=1 Tax=Gossypium stocksii TaxID=47602 RepID=A0A9D3WLE6_9ROSI|nr:hypothetical protein J1N35_002635 [Gossypium stocksii]
MKVEKEKRNLYQLAVQRRRRLRAKMHSLIEGASRAADLESSESVLDKLMGLLRVHVKRGVNLAVRDRLKTRIVKKDVNPEWNDDLTLSITDPDIPVSLTVYDHDTFSKDDKMGDSEFEVRSFIEALKTYTNLEEIPSGTVISRLKPSTDNCLVDESAIYVNDEGKIVQDLFLRLRNVECGEVEIQLQWIHYLGSKTF